MAKVIFAGAGTAGHVEPALAVAQLLRNSHPEIESVFLGTAEGVENTLVPAANFPLKLIDKTPFPRRVSGDLVSWPFRFRKTLLQTQKILEGADLVVGFGGYVAASAYLAARKAKIPIVAHEANAKMGMANKLAIRCGATMLGAFSQGNLRVVGIPLRESIRKLAGLSAEERDLAKKQARLSLNLDPDAGTVLVFGGSLGSKKFNKTVSEVQRDISALGFQVIHAVGAKNELPKAQAGYLPLQYIDEMARAYAACDLVISRSGAVTVFETGVLGIFALFVPLPIGNGEQAFNAQVSVARGGGELVKNEEFTPQWLINNISRLLIEAKRWRQTDSRLDFQLDASEQIAEQILKELAHG